MADTSNTIADGPTQLIVLKARGKHCRMAKKIVQLPDGKLGVQQHDGRKAYLYSHARTEDVSDVLKAARALSRIASDELVVRGALFAGLPPNFRRLLHADGNVQPSLKGVARSYVIFDIDGAHSVRSDYHPAADRELTASAVELLIDDLLPPEFHGISCWFGFTGSHGVKPGMNVRLFFNLARPMDTDELKAWLGYLCNRHVDTSVFSPAQQILIAPPILGTGLSDPVSTRSGMLRGHWHVVQPPSRDAIFTMTDISAASAKAPKARTVGASPQQQRCSAGGYEAALQRIGDGPDQDGIHNAILSAIGHWIRANGPDADTGMLVTEIETQVAEASIDPARHSPEYVADQVARVPQLVGEVAAMERARRAHEAKAQAERIRTPVTTNRRVIDTTADQAADAVKKAVHEFISSVPELTEQRNAAWIKTRNDTRGHHYPAPHQAAPWRKRGAVVVDMGVGKTDVAITEVTAMINAEPALRIGYVVPSHKLADDVVVRLNGAAGSKIAAVWRGMSQPDPTDPATAMCRRAKDVSVVQAAGGHQSLLCGSKARGFCQFRDNCEYRRQHQLDPRIWVVPAAMLTNAVPQAMQRTAQCFKIDGREHEASPPAFDLLVLDEAPFLNWLSGFEKVGFQIPVGWLDPTSLPADKCSFPPEAARVVQDAMRRLAAMAKALTSGDKTPEAYYADETAKCPTNLRPKFDIAVESLRASVDKPSVDPAITGDELAASLSEQTEAAQHVRAILRLIQVHELILDGKAPPSSVRACKLKSGAPAIRIFWRDEIHPSWLDNPVLYLDATARIRLAEQWLGKIEELVTAKAAAPHMRIIQVDDRQFGYRTVVVSSDEKLAGRAHQEQRKISDLMSVAGAGIGGTGLLVGPKAFVEQMHAAGRVPENWNIATFGSLRGVDAFKSASVAVIVSRQLPPPADVELMTEIAFGKPVQRIKGEWYPSTATVRLMADGTGRSAEVESHPDENVELIRWTICEAEVLQAIGRVRGVRRDEKNPVMVFVLNRVDLGDMPVSELMSWNEVTGCCGPTMIMAVRGCLPKMWSDVAHMLNWWKDAVDPAGNAKAWFRDNPDEGARRQQLFDSGQITHPFTGQAVLFRKESIGLIGKNHRYVWLTEEVSADDARAMLSSGTSCHDGREGGTV